MDSRANHPDFFFVQKAVTHLAAFSGQFAWTNYEIK
jgi:hypothetical protein